MLKLFGLSLASAVFLGCGVKSQPIPPEAARPEKIVGLEGYGLEIVERAPIMATGTTVSFARARVRGKKVSVAAVDRSGNVGPAAIAHPH